MTSAEHRLAEAGRPRDVAEGRLLALRSQTGWPTPATPSHAELTAEIGAPAADIARFNSTLEVLRRDLAMKHPAANSGPIQPLLTPEA